MSRLISVALIALAAAEEGNSTAESNSTGNHSNVHDPACEEEHIEIFEILLFPVTSLLVAMFCALLMHRIGISIPETVLCFAWGAIGGGISRASPDNVLSKSFDLWGNPEFVNPTTYLFLLLPVLVFNDSLHLNLAVFSKMALSSIALATIGVLVGALLIAIGATYMLPLPEKLQLTFFEALTLGAITSATDPVAALAVLKRSGASAYLSTVVAGEALINDGTALVLVKISSAVAFGCGNSSIGDGIVQFLKLAFGGLGIGTCLGIGAFILIYVCQKSHVEPIESGMFSVIVSVICGFSAFAVAERAAGVSGVLSTMGAGLALNFLWRIDRKHGGELQHTLWEFLEYIFNTLLFALAGVAVGRYDLTGPISNDGALGAAMGSAFLIVLYTLISRALVLLMMWPLIKYLVEDTLGWKDGVVMWWAGLRGAVGLLIAIEVSETKFDTETDEGKHQEERAEMILLFVSALTLVTLVIFAPTIGWLLKKLNMLSKTEAENSREEVLRNLLNVKAQREEKALKKRSRFKNADADELAWLVAAEKEEKHITLMDLAMNKLALMAESSRVAGAPSKRYTGHARRPTGAAQTEMSTPHPKAPPPSEMGDVGYMGGMDSMDHSDCLNLARGLYLRVVSTTLHAHLDVERVAVANMSILGTLEKVIEENKIDVDTPLDLWSKLLPRLKSHRKWVAFIKKCKKSLKFYCQGWGSSLDQSLFEEREEQASRTEVAALAGFVCVLDEAWEEIAHLTGYVEGPTVEADKADVPTLPMRLLHNEVKSQVELAQVCLEQFSTEDQTIAAFTKEAAIMTLRKRIERVDHFEESGLWSEAEAMQSRHHIEEQLNVATDLKLLNRTGKPGMATTIADKRASKERRPTLAAEGNFVEKHDGSIRTRFSFMCCGDRHRPSLEHITDHNNFTRAGVHYVTWLDTFFNRMGRPPFLDLKMLLIAVVSTVLVDIVVNNRTGTWLDLGLGKDTMAYLTFVVSLLLVFRVGESNVRYIDARKKWGMMVNRTRDLSRQFFCYCPDSALNARANRWIISFVFASKQALRMKTDCTTDLAGVLPPEELEALHQAKHKAIYCFEQMNQCICDANRAGHLDTRQVRMMDKNVTGFNDYIGACERILKTPVPFGIVLHLRTFVLLYIFCVPLYLAEHGSAAFGAICSLRTGECGLGWGALPVTIIFAFCLLGIEDLAGALENPFRQSWHCLPLDAICKTIKTNLLEIQSRHTIKSGE